jgi:hypothetical protein
MNHVNLIPAQRILARRRRRRIRRWAVAAGVYVTALAAACGLVGLTLNKGDLGLDAELRETERRITEARSPAATVRGQLAAAEAKLAIHQTVRGQPDWSLLLAGVANRLEENIVLRSCRIAPPRESGARVGRGMLGDVPATAGPRGGPRRMVLTVAGYGRSLKDVSQFVIRLEDLGCFDSVRLAHNAREPFLAGTAIAFEAECVLAGEDAGI